MQHYFPKLFIAIGIFLLAILGTSLQSYGQTSRTDSILSKQRVARELAKRDSILQAAKQKQRQDSINRVLQKQRIIAYRDSLKRARIIQRTKDSIKKVELKEKLLAERRKRDSIRAEQKKVLLAIAAQKKKSADSLRQIQNARRDSIVQARAEAKRIRDAFKKYKNSKRYKDSVYAVRKAKTDSIKAARAKRLAIQKERQQKTIDSLKKARAENVAKIKAERKRKLDSTKLARQNYSDSLKNAREVATTLLKEKRKRELDSIKLARTKYNDSLKTARKKYTDSLIAERKAKKDSLEKYRAENNKEKKKKQSLAEIQKEKARQIHERKKGSWTNEKLLKKNWSIHRRIYQNTVTRYNSYYNAKRKYDEAMINLRERKQDNYTEQISLLPYKVDGAVSLIGNEMDTVVKKCAFDAQIHDPRSKWFDNVYFLMGRAFFFKNDYQSAITAFQFVINEYKKPPKRKKGNFIPPALNEIKFDSKNRIKLATVEKRTGTKTLAHHSARNDALVWLIRAYIYNEQYAEAQSLYYILIEDPNFPDRLKDDLYFAQAELNLVQQNNLGAIEPLEKALKQEDIDKTLKQRAYYLLAQLYKQDGNITASNKYFEKALENKLPLEMEYFTQLNLASNTLAGAGNKEKTIAQLEKIAKEERFSEWRGQTFLTLGKILAEKDQDQAITYLDKSLAQEDNSINVQAGAYEQLGSIYFDKSEYALAKLNYDSALVYGQTATPPLNNMDEVKLRKEVLGDLVKFTSIIQTEDSLQTLSKKPRKDQIAAINKELKRRRKEERRKRQEEASKLTAVALTPGNFGRKAWYFYNNTVVQKGIIDFESIWGKRPLVDNWRRSNSNASTTENGQNGLAGSDSSQNSNSTETQKMLDALYTENKEFDASNERIVEAYYQLALIYSSRLDDAPRAINTHNILVQRYPENNYEPHSYYSLYLLHNKLKQIDLATKYKNFLLAKYDTTKFASLVADPGKKSKEEAQTLMASNFYDSTYNVFQRADYINALKQAIAGKEKFPNNELNAKFDLIRAQSLAAMKDIDSARGVTEKIIMDYPGTKEMKYAQRFLKYLKGRGIAQRAGVSQATNQTTQKSVGSSKKTSAVFTHQPKTTHYLLIYLKKIDGNTMGLKAGFSDFNAMRYANKKHKTNMNLLDRSTAIISINQFANAKEANKYRKAVTKEKALFRNLSPNMYEIMIISSENFKELLKTRKIKEYQKFYNKKYF